MQRLQIEPVSKASARQRAGRCGRVCEGVCIRLYSEKDWEDRPDFTDPEIRRSALAGALLRMKDLGLPEMPEFPLPDPPSSKLVTEGYRTLREIGALDKARQLTPVGKKLARLPIDPRLARMLLEAQHEQALPEMLVIVAGLGIMDPVNALRMPLRRRTRPTRSGRKKTVTSYLCSNYGRLHGNSGREGAGVKTSFGNGAGEISSISTA